MVALVAPLLAWACLAASFVIALAAVVRMAGPVPGGADVSGVIRLPGQMTAAVVTLFALAALVFLVDRVRRGWSRRTGEGEAERAEEPDRTPPWLRRLAQILSIVNVVVLAYLLWRGGFTQEGLFLGAGGLAGGFSLPGIAPESAPAVLTWAFGILAVAAGLGALGLALWVALGDHLRRDGDEDVAPAPAPLDALVAESVEDLRAEPDPRRAIVRCYARFERAAAESGLARKPWLTPMEFMRETLARLPVPRAAVPTLTGLFELARFSHHALGPRERDRALEALHEISAAIQTSDGDAHAR
jgi:hypothetical protein